MSSSALEPTLGTAVWSAVTTHVQNDAGSLSEESSESHATERSSPGASASHSARSVVLPNPAGADTSVSLDSAPRRRRTRSLGRVTRPRRSFGTYSLVAIIGRATRFPIPWCTTLPRVCVTQLTLLHRTTIAVSRPRLVTGPRRPQRQPRPGCGRTADRAGPGVWPPGGRPDHRIQPQCKRAWHRQADIPLRPIVMGND